MASSGGAPGASTRLPDHERHRHVALANVNPEALKEQQALPQRALQAPPLGWAPPPPLLPPPPTPPPPPVAREPSPGKSSTWGSPSAWHGLLTREHSDSSLLVRRGATTVGRKPMPGGSSSPQHPSPQSAERLPASSSARPPLNRRTSWAPGDLNELSDSAKSRRVWFNTNPAPGHTSLSDSPVSIVSAGGSPLPPYRTSSPLTRPPPSSVLRQPSSSSTQRQPSSSSMHAGDEVPPSVRPLFSSSFAQEPQRRWLANKNSVVNVNSCSVVVDVDTAQDRFSVTSLRKRSPLPPPRKNRSPMPRMMGAALRAPFRSSRIELWRPSASARASAGEQSLQSMGSAWGSGSAIGIGSGSTYHGSTDCRESAAGRETSARCAARYSRSSSPFKRRSGSLRASRSLDDDSLHSAGEMNDPLTEVSTQPEQTHKPHPLGGGYTKRTPQPQLLSRRRAAHITRQNTPPHITAPLSDARTHKGNLTTRRPPTQKELPNHKPADRWTHAPPPTKGAFLAAGEALPGLHGGSLHRNRRTTLASDPLSTHATRGGGFPRNRRSSDPTRAAGTF